MSIKKPVIALHRNVFERLLKVATALDIPAEIIAESGVIKEINKYWDLKNERPLGKKK